MVATKYDRRSGQKKVAAPQSTAPLPSSWMAELRGDMRTFLESCLRMSPMVVRVWLNPDDMYDLVHDGSRALKPWILEKPTGIVECVAHGGVPKGRALMEER